MFPATEPQLELLLSEPPEYLARALTSLPGDLLVLGAGGKMGPSLCHLAKRAAELAGTPRKVIAVSRFSDSALAAQLESWGIDVIRGDLLDRRFVAALPAAPLVVAMTGQKFGTSAGGQARTWAMNVHVPALVCQRFAGSRIAAFSSGNVYGLVPVADGRGSRETDVPEPVGEYAMSVLGRERIYEYFSRELRIPVSIIRLNYATELRYGVLVDIARRVWERQPVSVAMGYANVIWQGDANALALASLAHAASPPLVLNVAGPDFFRCRDVAQQFAERFGLPIEFEGQEAPTALLNDAALSRQLFGPPRVTTETLIDWTSQWIRLGGTLWDKPTHYEVRDGRF
jgi:dTDP-4-dehydrorhamnose reductase